MSEPSASERPHPTSQQAFLRLFLASEREVLRYVSALVPSQLDAQEIVQDTAVLLWEKFDQYDPARPFTPWACRFALNVARQWMGRRKRWKTLLDKGLAEELLARREELKSEFDDRLLHLPHCIEQLPDSQRKLIEGYYVQQLGIDEISVQARRSVEAAYKALQRIRQKLKLCIERTLAEDTRTESPR